MGLHWIHRGILFHGRQHREMAAPGVPAFLTHLAVACKELAPTRGSPTTLPRSSSRADMHIPTEGQAAPRAVPSL